VDLKGQVERFSDDFDLKCSELDALSLKWQKERCQWAKEKEYLKLEANQRSQLVQRIIDETNGTLRNEMLVENSTYVGRVAMLEMQLKVKEEELRFEKMTKNGRASKAASKALAQQGALITELKEIVDTSGTHREDLVQSLRDTMAQITDVFGEPWSHSCKKIHANIKHEGLSKTVATLMRYLSATNGGCLAIEVKTILVDWKIVGDFKIATLSCGSESEHFNFQNWLSLLADAKWPGDGADVTDLIKKLRKVLKLDHSWKKYIGIKPSPELVIEDERSYRKTAPSGYTKHEQYLIAQVHQECNVFSGFCIDGESRVQMLPQQKLNMDHFVRGEEKTHFMYYWAHEEEHKELGQEGGDVGFEFTKHFLQIDEVNDIAG